jgi:hypothetical protein
MSIYLVVDMKHGERNTRAINDVFQVQLLRALESIDTELAYEYNTPTLIKLESKSTFCLSRFIEIEDTLEELMNAFISGMKFTELSNEIEVLFINWDEVELYGELYRTAMSSDMIMRTKSRRVNSTDSAEEKEKFIKHILDYGEMIEGVLEEELENSLDKLLGSSNTEEVVEEPQSRSNAEALWMLNAAKVMVSLEEKINKLTESLEKIEKKVFNN